MARRGNHSRHPQHGETSAILEVMTRAHGRHSAWCAAAVRASSSRCCSRQPRRLLWRARLDEHLGTFQAEAIEMNAARLMDSAVAVYGLQTMAAHLGFCPSATPCGLYETLAIMIRISMMPTPPANWWRVSSCSSSTSSVSGSTQPMRGDGHAADSPMSRPKSDAPSRAGGRTLA